MGEFTEFFWNNWMIVVFIAPFLWSLINIVDVYFVRSVYRDASEGVIVSGLFQIFPWLFVAFGLLEFRVPEWPVLLLGLAGGGLYLLSYYFYFKSLFIVSDSVLIQIFWSLSMPLVPFLAFFLIGEKLFFINYLGILLVFGGIVIFLFKEDVRLDRIEVMRIMKIMAGAVVAMALSMVLQREMYKGLGDDFWSGYLLFSLGYLLCGVLFWIGSRDTRIISLCRERFFSFAAIEILVVVGTVFAQRALSISPSVSIVAVIESLSPVFVMLLSGALVLVAMALGKGKAEQIQSISQDQLVNFKTKLISLIIILFGIYLVS